ncbi:MAG: class I SAM-dependent methyltransferase [Chitinophagales bacterium]
MGINATEAVWKLRRKCRCCGAEDIAPFLDLGKIPIADALLTNPQDEEAIIPLSAAFCNGCCAVQVMEDVEATSMFNAAYPYFTAANPALVKHFTDSAEHIIRQHNILTGQLVIEVGSNDGTMLNVFKQHGMQVLGIDPSGPAESANKNGIRTIQDFFTHELAGKLRMEGASARLILANNVFAHVPEPNSMVLGWKELLAEDGLIIFEVPYLYDLITKLEFDTIFHQHYSYFSVHCLKSLLEKHGLYLNDVERISIHGGSIRVTASAHKINRTGVTALLAMEEAAGLTDFSLFHDFAERVKALKSELQHLLMELKQQGKSIEGYGAAGKANTLVNYVGIGSTYIHVIADKSTHKQGKYFPGIKLPIVKTEELLELHPDYILILAWNFADDIMRELEAYHSNGGKFIIPIPSLRIV